MFSRFGSNMKSKIGFAALLLAACASEVHRIPVEFSSSDPGANLRLVLNQSVEVVLDSRYRRSIREGTEFVEAGVIKQGKILKPVNATLTVEGAHMHEAYPVLEGARIVGFYLPVERAFAPLSRTVSVTLTPKEEK